MSNRPNNRPHPKAVQRQRPATELKFSLVLAPPDGPQGDDGNLLPQRLDIDLRSWPLADRELAKRALSKFVQPDAEDVVLVHAWIVWRRSNPTSSLQTWMENITLGDLLDGLNMDPGRVTWDTTPEGYDPEALSVT